LARKILLADDSVTAQNMGRRILSEAGYEVVTVNNGPAALKKIAEYKPHLVILDVYMPGYGGLEVCQRIKEGEETAHIPVLLTVGKLEPFKADEARRVRADGHLVKPFEASELLTILTKLEDKIVPEPDPKARSRSAGGLATGRMSSTSAKGKGFGDADSGWKDRLSIPSPAAKPKLAEPEPAEAKAATAFRSIPHESESREDESRETAHPAPAAPPGLAQDITAEEIAAITAAAAAFAEKDKATEPASPATTNVTEQPTASVASASEGPAAEAISEQAEPVGASQAEAATPEGAPAPEAAVEAGAISPDSVSETAPETAPAEAVPEADVVAALESLAPANGHEVAAEAALSVEHPAEIEEPEEVPVAVGMAAQGEIVQGPRWVADEVALAADDAALILDREMQKVYAAMAGMRPEAPSSSVAQIEAASFRESEPMPPAAELPPTAQQAESPAEARFEEPSSQAAPLPCADPSPTQQPAEPPVEERATESSPAAEIATPELPHTADAVAEPPSAPADAVAAPDASRAEGPEQSELDASAAGLAAEPRPATAYAAAASAGPAFQAISTDEHPRSAAPSEPGESTPSPVAAEVTPEREAELAAAWAHWRQVRESLASPQFVSQVADATAAEFKDIHSSANAGAPAGPDSASAAAPENPAAIANIVDNVLAELKPKLVEEIAKKLGKEKQ
jgi:CheY-like chemotaxis protein